MRFQKRRVVALPLHWERAGVRERSLTEKEKKEFFIFTASQALRLSHREREEGNATVRFLAEVEHD
jgi:hypothetical protein